jgi:hypothetical protein
MAKNKKKSFSKVVITQTVSNNSDTDDNNKCAELTPVPHNIDMHDLPKEEVELITSTEQNDLSNNLQTNIDIENKLETLQNNVLEEQPDTIIESSEPKDTSIEVEEVVNIDKQQNTEKQNTEIENSTVVKDNNNEPLELKEIQINPQENSQSEKKTITCNRAWCSIL